MRPLGDEGDACQSKKCAPVCEIVGAPRRGATIAEAYERMFVGILSLGVAFGANAPTILLWVAPRRGAPTKGSTQDTTHLSRFGSCALQGLLGSLNLEMTIYAQAPA